MSSFIQTQGVVLSNKLLPGNDVIYTVLTAAHGKLRVYGKGVKNIMSKRKPHVQTGNLVSLVIRKNRDQYYLQETSLISAFSSIKHSVEKITWLYPYLFMVDRLMPEHEVDAAVYHLLQRYLIALSAKHDSQEQFVTYANQLMVQLGYSDTTLSLSEISNVFSETTGQNLPINTI